MKLKDKVCIITGGSKGIGLGCSKVFAKYGAVVIISARNPKDGDAAVNGITATGGNAEFVACDVTNDQQMKQLIDGTAAKHGRLDCIVNNAGWHPPAMSIDDTSLEDFENLLRLNLTSTFLGCKYAVPHLRKTKGNIVNMSSAVALMGQARAASYVTTKAGQIGMTKALALDLIREGIRVNAVCPSSVLTPLMEQWAATEHDPAAALKAVEATQPAGRMATIEEMGEVCAFLASDEASYITGQAIAAEAGAMLGYGVKFAG
jgi:NAD(P)-dependent dehydrogenase (short-subunit alcohol dehydrogenase family)